jgi:signal transduction histidine kinase
VEYAGPKDELGRLAITFNGMLARLQDAYDRVAHSLQLQPDFVTDVSHELRTPLTTVRGNLALLKRAPPLPDEERREILGDLTEESERLSRLVNDLLTLAHADAGREPEIERVDVFELVEDACRQAQVLARGRDIRCAARERVVARANADALKQVLLILLDNAVKHAQDPIRVSVEEEDDEVVMRVRDEGPGMAPELQERVFQRFYRGDRSRSTEGFGLGLSIARALLERLDGILEVESAPGEGSTFTVRVPRAVDDSAGQSAG